MKSCSVMASHSR